MPTIVGSKSGTRPHLELDWTATSQDITNNRTKLNLKLYLKVNYTIKYSARYTGTLQGVTFTSSSGYISKPGRYKIAERDIWVNHNSDGSKTQKLTADYNLNINWSNVYHGKISLSGDAKLATIPRATTISAFSFASSLQLNKANTINYTVSKKHANYRNRVQLRDGSHVIKTWDNQNSNGSSTVGLTAGEVATIMGRMSTVTSKSFTLRIDTRSGHNGGWVGSNTSRTASASINANVKPTATSLTHSQVGNNVSSHYLQSISKIKASFTGTARGGATVTSRSIVVRKVGPSDSQTISNGGTTANPIKSTGTYEIIGTVTDSRKRSATVRTTFTATGYSPPTISSFTVARQGSKPAVVDIHRSGTVTALGSSNKGTITIQKRVFGGNWSNVTTPVVYSGGGYNGSLTDSNILVTNSYEFRLIVKDSFNNSVEALTTISTQQVVLDIFQDTGVGVGKMYERGTLDVGGVAYFEGTVHFLNGIQSQRLPRGTDINNITRTGFYYNPLNNDVKTMKNIPNNEACSLLVEQTAGTKQTWTRYGRNVKDTWIRQYYSGGWGSWQKVI